MDQSEREKDFLERLHESHEVSKLQPCACLFNMFGMKDNKNYDVSPPPNTYSTVRLSWLDLLVDAGWCLQRHHLAFAHAASGPHQ